MSEDAIPEPDCLADAVHPRATVRLFGQTHAENEFLESYNSGRLHHAWLVTGPRGVGKATLAWRIARFLLATPDESADALFGEPLAVEALDVDPSNPVARRMMALSEPRMFLLRRPWDAKAKRLRKEITVDEARKLKGFFAMSAADGGRRVVIIDAADDLNTAAANAVLKVLEEPPERTFLLLVSHQPSRLLPTIRSRCRTLRCAPLAAEDMASALAALETPMPADNGPVTALSAGSVGTAHTLLQSNGLELYGKLVNLLSGSPGLNRQAALEFCGSVGARGAEIEVEQVLDLLELLLSRLSRTGALGPPAPEAAPGEAALLSRLCPDARSARHWAQLAQEIAVRTRHGLAVNLDPAALLLDTMLKLDAGAGKLLPAKA